MSARQGAPDFATQMAEFTQQLTALQGKVATLRVANATLQANNLTLTTQINALGGQPPNVQAVGGTGATATTVATLVQFVTTPAMVRHKEIIDYATKLGTLIYQEGCEALTTPFKMKSNGTVIYSKPNLTRWVGALGLNKSPSLSTQTAIPSPSLISMVKLTLPCSKWDAKASASSVVLVSISKQGKTKR
jgi:hypothetical protein